jgi:hypothetical protein
MLSVCVACGNDNKAAPYVEKSKAESAREALDNKDFATAVELYAELVEESPEDFKTYSLYAASLAGFGGVSLLSVVLDQLSAGASGGGVLSLIDQIVPAEITDEKTAAMKDAVEILELIPDTAMEADAELRSSASLQKTVYSAVYTAMLVDSLLNIQEGQITQENLENLTEEQAVQIIDAFILAGEAGDPNNPLTQAMSQAGESINGASGEGAKARLQEYFRQQ